MNFRKSFLLIAILVSAGVFLFWGDLSNLVSKFSDEFTDLKTSVTNLINNKEIILPGPLRSLQDSSSSFLTREGIIQWTNTQRQRNGLPPLKENLELDHSASIKVQDMLAKQYFEHVSPSGVSVSELANQVGYDFIAIGENLALGNFKDDETVVQAWMDSPGHRANILNTKYQDIGVAVIKGQFEGHTTWLAVQHFGLSTAVCPTVNSSLKQTIDRVDAELVTMRQQLDAMKADLDNTEPKHGDTYNQKVEAYNAAVKAYNNLLDQQKAQIIEYNNEVNAANNCYQSYK